MISIIIPFYNEEENLPILLNQLFNILKNIKREWEIVLTDDGSTDNSLPLIKYHISKLPIKNQKGIKIISHRKRLGKGQALNTGVENSKGEIIVFMDADLQDDPADLPKFLAKINQGYDLVNGVRIKRREKLIIRAYSLLAKYFLKIFLHSPFSDINCGFKAFKKTVLEDTILYGNNFRFLPLAVYYHGFKVTEIPVNNRPRRFGQSKFGATKLFIGILDTLTAYFLYQFSEKPLHFFGFIGGVLFLFGFLLSFYLTIERLFFNVLLYRRPILFLGVLLIIVGVQVVMTGIIGELIVYLDKKKLKT